jgi:hypothetical protein
MALTASYTDLQLALEGGKSMRFGIGQPVRRKEDPSFLTGRRRVSPTNLAAGSRHYFTRTCAEWHSLVGIRAVSVSHGCRWLLSPPNQRRTRGEKELTA